MVVADEAALLAALAAVVDARVDPDGHYLVAYNGDAGAGGSTSRCSAGAVSPTTRLADRLRGIDPSPDAYSLLHVSPTVVTDALAGFERFDDQRPSTVPPVDCCVHDPRREREQPTL